jgi:hypothetical protein
MDIYNITDFFKDDTRYGVDFKEAKSLISDSSHELQLSWSS